MKIEIIKEKDNAFLKRKEFSVKIEHEKASTPSKASLQQLFSKQFNHSVDSIEIINIFSDHGFSHSLARIFVWSEKKVHDLSQIRKSEESSEKSDKKSDESAEKSEEKKE